MGNRLVIRLGKNGLVAVSVFFVALSGYTATELIQRSAPSVTPPSPYASQEPADCGTPELEPVRCPAGGGDGCPDPTPSQSGSATAPAEAMPAPTGTYSAPIGDARFVVCVEATYPE
ncbi:hypothetical protein QFZ82_001775 [Streptomyces sp. V4I23]|uniref:hypothetical protein n=1 Tax=Streptomyces sp. V4I23 TaxID=3042282 RepID=UPI00277F3D1A|nr:hypothetical protein [Streptomyces sp. V4I23]MDQ1007290.1 hypothetical protein [Streptomyces sp. V4I23]